MEKKIYNKPVIKTVEMKNDVMQTEGIPNASGGETEAAAKQGTFDFGSEE